MAIGSVSIAERRGRPEPEGGDRQDPRAAADVEDPRAGEHAPVRQRLRAREAQARRRMEPGPERHPRIEREDDVAGLAAMAPPGRPDDQTSPDAQDREVRLPGFGPVGLVDDPDPQLADRTQAERLEVAERLGHVGRGAVGGRSVASRQVGADDGRPGRVEPGAQALVDQLERGLDRGPAGRRPAEDLADRLDRFDVGLDRELQPGAGAGGAVVAQPSPSFSSSPPPWPTASPDSSA